MHLQLSLAPTGTQLGPDRITHPSFTPIFHVLTSVGEGTEPTGANICHFLLEGWSVWAGPTLTVQRPRPRAMLAGAGGGGGEQVLGHLLAFWNCDSRTAVLLGSAVPSPGTSARGHEHSHACTAEGDVAPCGPARVRHDCEAERRAQCPRAHTFRGCRAFRGKTMRGQVFSLRVRC